MGAVHEATGLPVAVKAVPGRPGEAEVALVAGLDHPHVVPVLDYGRVPEGGRCLRARRTW
ncbi:MAG: hypothetical protein R3F59_38015 [Myxococcota bacterium]